MTQYFPINGTHENRQEGTAWSSPVSPLSTFLAAHGLSNFLLTRPSFDWSDDLDLFAWDHHAWEAAGQSILNYLVPPLAPERRWPPDETVLITHSHGIQAALYAAAQGLKIDRLLDVAGPVRSDMMDVARQARPNIRRWLHVHSDFSDRMQWLGEMFDGHFGIIRQHPLADVNVGIKKVGHSGLLRNPKYFELWVEDGLVDFLTDRR
jgi:hypothetical protein